MPPDERPLEPTVQAMQWPGDGRMMLRLPDGLWVDERPVTGSDYARFVAATGHRAPRGWEAGAPPTGREDQPVVHVDIEDARAFARWAGKRLPLQREFGRATRLLDFQRHLGGGLVWEWTGSPHREGHVVRGGPYRNRREAQGEAGHRSWEDAGAADLGLRCVADDSLRTLPPATMTGGDDDDVIVDAGADAIHGTPRGIAVVGDGVVVHVEVVDHELLVRSPRIVRRHGLTSAGVLAAVRLAWQLTVQRHAEHAIVGALDEAVRRHAVRACPALATVPDAMTAMGIDFIPPLLWSRGVVQRPHLVQDLSRLRPAAVALSMLDGREDADDASPEYAAVLGHLLVHWQRLYRHPDSAARSVNRTLALYGDEATPTALWGLRSLALRAPITSLQHLEVLGHLAAVIHDPEELSILRDAVERATDTELGEALVLVDEGEEITRQAWQAPAGQLAEILSAVSAVELRGHLGRRPRFREHLEEALHALRHVLRLRTLVAEPPIPPPVGVRFLGTVAEIADEGVRMDHCVASRAPRALAGQSYIFHIDHDGHRATAEVSASGDVVEIRGPRNTTTPACTRGRRILRPWGRLVRVLRHVPEPFPVTGRVVVPAGLRQVATARALVDAAIALIPGTGDHGEALARHVDALATAAAAGEAVACLDGDGAIVQLDRSGLVVATSRELRDASFEDTLPGGMPRVLGLYDDPDLMAPPGWYDEDDDGWDLRT